jgi:murein DD-endopeptidase MepM/ murein hydrolase activator NlpD
MPPSSQIGRSFYDRVRPLPLLATSGVLLAAVATAVAVTPEQPIRAQMVTEQLTFQNSAVLDNSDQIFLSETRIESGDTLQQLLKRLNAADLDAVAFLRNSPEATQLRQEFVAGRSVFAQTSNQGKLLSLQFPLGDKERMLFISRGNNDTLTGTIVSSQTETHTVTRSAQIESSLFAASDLAAIPDTIAIQMAEIFGSEIDFHRDLRKGDRFTVSYEVEYVDGRPLRTGKIIAAEFINEGRSHRAIWFEQDKDKGQYLSPEGKPIRKSFLRSPLEFSRVSSGFSRRFHPILKTWRAHQGVDYAAPTGTPVRATGNAIVQFAGNQNGYGNVVILRHDDKHSTVYAHLSRFAKNAKKGGRIAQGEVIGHVGQTGWATGPHLHYEFRINNTPVNPLTVKAASYQANLNPAQLKAFTERSKPTLAMLERLKQSDITYLE